MKMYIMVREEIPLGFAINSVGHASLAVYLKFKEEQDTKDWLEHSFKKVTCIVNKEEFEFAKTIADSIIITEDGYNDEEICIAFKPRHEYPNQFRNYRLYSSRNIK